MRRGFFPHQGAPRPDRRARARHPRLGELHPLNRRRPLSVTRGARANRIPLIVETDYPRVIARALPGNPSASKTACSMDARLTSRMTQRNVANLQKETPMAKL